MEQALAYYRDGEGRTYAVKVGRGGLYSGHAKEGDGRWRRVQGLPRRRFPGDAMRDLARYAEERGGARIGGTVMTRKPSRFERRLNERRDARRMEGFGRSVMGLLKTRKRQIKLACDADRRGGVGASDMPEVTAAEAYRYMEAAKFCGMWG